MSTKPRAIVMNAADTVATLLVAGRKGASIGLLTPDLRRSGTVELRESIRAFHKVAIRSMAEGERVVKLGEAIGRASAAILPGDWVHVHNVVSGRL